MKAKVLLAALPCVLLAGCLLRRTPAKSVAAPAAPAPLANAAPAPPPPALSIPQTHVELPKPQPVDPEALETEPPPPEAPPAAAATTAPPRSRRANPAVSQPAPTPPAAAGPPADTRETFQEIVPPAELKRLQEDAHARRREANQILEQLGRRLSGSQQNVAATIRSFLALSAEAENRNDLRQADSLAERAQILAKELQSGK
jgi:hypothetical protein